MNAYVLVILGPIVTAVMAVIIKKFFTKLSEIHILVNARLTEALAKIEKLEALLGDSDQADNPDL